MGTNYYAIKKLNSELKVEIITAVVEGQIYTLQKLIPETIHIGKSSAGWNFLFNHNNWEHYNAETILEYLADCHIVNEYGDEVPFCEFTDMVTVKSHFKRETQYGEMINGFNFSNYTEFS